MSMPGYFSGVGASALPGGSFGMGSVFGLTFGDNAVSPRYGLVYMKRDEGAYAEQVRDHLEKNLHRWAKELGNDVVEKPEATAV